MLDSHFVIFDVLGFASISFPAELRASQGSSERLFSVFVSGLILI